MNPSTLKSLKITNHGWERYCQRVAKIPEGKIGEEQMKNWFRAAISKGTKLPEPGEKGATLYLYRGHKVVYMKNTNSIISVLPYKPEVDEQSEYHDVKSAVSSLVERKLAKNIKKLRHQYRQTMIALHTEEIKRLSVYNPNTQDTIAKRVFDIQKDINKIESKIKGIELVAEQYGIEL